MNSKQFAKLSKPQRAFLVAQDALKQLPKLKVKAGSYIDGKITLPKTHSSKNAQRHIAKIVKKCDVCALGACLVSKIKLFNKVTLNDLALETEENVSWFTLDSEAIPALLGDIFSDEQMLLVEAAFEGAPHVAIDFPDNDALFDAYMARAESYGRAYPNARDRLRAILLNIVRNNGLFLPDNVTGDDETGDQAVCVA